MQLKIYLLALLVPASALAGVTIDWRAETEPIGSGFGGDGWDAFAGAQHDDWSSAAPTVGIVAIGDSAIEAFVSSTQTVVFDGSQGLVSINTWDNQYNGADKSTGLFEIWFSPDDFSDRDLLFETGGSADGVGIVLDNSVLKFGISSGNAGADAYALTSVDLQDFVDNHGFTLGTDYLKLSAQIKQGSDRVELTVNDINGNFLFGSSQIVGGGGGDIVDWSGGNHGGLGRVNGDVGGNRANQFGGGTGAWTAFEGEIARFTFSTGIVPEPQTLGMIAAGMLGLMAIRRRRKVIGTDTRVAELPADDFYQS